MDSLKRFFGKMTSSCECALKTYKNKNKRMRKRTQRKKNFRGGYSYRASSTCKGSKKSCRANSSSVKS